LLVNHNPILVHSGYIPVNQTISTGLLCENWLHNYYELLNVE
jgi:hypothetical protein